MEEAVSYSDMLVNVYQTPWYYVPEDSRHRENMKPRCFRSKMAMREYSQPCKRFQVAKSISVDCLNLIHVQVTENVEET